MKKLLFITALVITTAVSGQNNWGLGVRLGDPSGLTIKKYMSKTALELNVGRTNWLYGNGWYNGRFYSWYKAERLGYKEFEYVGYRTTMPASVQLHYLFRKGINKVGEETVNGLEWYWGFGAQFAYQRYYYDYRYKLDGDPYWHYATGGYVSDIDLGADGVLGLEYTFKEAPISLFLDMTLFMEVVDEPILLNLQGGIGARYNFSK